jgi:hypothetical protein
MEIGYPLLGVTEKQRIFADSKFENQFPLYMNKKSHF